jgi:hypothetical protein
LRPAVICERQCGSLIRLYYSNNSFCVSNACSSSRGRHGARNAISIDLSVGTPTQVAIEFLAANDGWIASPVKAVRRRGRRPAFTGLATQPYSATEVDGWEHKLSRVSQSRAAVHYPGDTPVPGGSRQPQPQPPPPRQLPIAFAYSGSAVRICLGVFPVQRLHACMCECTHLAKAKQPCDL